MIVASLIHKRVTIISSMSISLLFLLINNPYSILDIGLQLSYGGTIGIVLAMGTEIFEAIFMTMEEGAARVKFGSMGMDNAESKFWLIGMNNAESKSWLIEMCNAKAKSWSMKAKIFKPFFKRR